jgi:hypothetical protein
VLPEPVARRARLGCARKILRAEELEAENSDKRRIEWDGFRDSLANSKLD